MDMSKKAGDQGASQRRINSNEERRAHSGERQRKQNDVKGEKKKVSTDGNQSFRADGRLKTVDLA